MSTLDPMQKNLEIAIRKKPLVSIRLMQRFPLVKFGERKRKQLLLEDVHYHCEV
jgi:hypothetical protein